MSGAGLVPPPVPPRHPSSPRRVSSSGADTPSSRPNAVAASSPPSVRPAASPAAALELEQIDQDARLAAALAELEAERGESAAASPAAASPSALGHSEPSRPPLPPPRRSQDATSSRAVTPAVPARPSGGATATPPPFRSRRTSSASVAPSLQTLDDLEDFELAELVDRVGHRLTDVRVAEAADVRFRVEYPDREQYRRPAAAADKPGKIDWLSYTAAYAACLATDWVPASLVEPATAAPTRAAADDFSLRELRDELERTYVLLPPPVVQKLALAEFAALWQWHDPRKTGGALAAYLCLWYWDLLFLAPCLGITAALAKARFFPPSPEDLLELAQHRQARSRDARVLSKQLKSSNLYGVAGHGVKGLWQEIKSRKRDREARSTQAASAAAATAEAAASAAAAAMGEEAEEALEDTAAPVDPAATEDSEASAPASGTVTARPNGALSALLTSATPVLSAPAAGPATASATTEAAVAGQDADPARAPGGKEGDGDVSLYRLSRNLMAAYGPTVVVWLGELNDVGERVKNLAVHPEHPAVVYVGLRLLVASLALVFTPVALVYKSLLLYVALEIFVLWKLRSMYPEWRGATLLHRWLLLGAPNDVEYALYALRQRQLAGKPLHGARTLKRRSRAREGTGDSPPREEDAASADANGASGSASGVKGEKTKARARAVGNVVNSVLDEADRYRSRKSSDFGGGSGTARGAGDAASVVSIPRSKPDASYFALYASKPGSLCLLSDRLAFTPARHLQTVGRISSLFRSAPSSPGPKPDSSDDEAEADSVLSSSSGSAKKSNFRSTLSSVLAEGGEVAILYEQIEGVTKQVNMKAFEGLLVKTKDGRSFSFRNVARRDEAFTKLLAFTALEWKQR